mgnify:CR=1 FL=1
MLDKITALHAIQSKHSINNKLLRIILYIGTTENVEFKMLHDLNVRPKNGKISLRGISPNHQQFLINNREKHKGSGLFKNHLKLSTNGLDIYNQVISLLS